MQLTKTVRKAKHITADMIIGIDTTIRVQGGTISKLTGKCPTRKTRVWRKVRHVLTDDVISKNITYFVVRNNSGNLEFLKRNINTVIPVKVHPNTKVNKAKR